MLIGIDMDDVLADFINPLIKFHNEVYGTSLTKEQVFSYAFWEVWGGTREEAIRKVAEFHKSNYYDLIQPTPGAVNAVGHLRKDHGLVVITSRPDNVREKTFEWIKRYFPYRFSGTYFAYNHHIQNKGKRKSEICRDLGVDVLIDDMLKYATECAENGTRVLLFNQPWNQSTELPPRMERVFSWNDVLEKLIYRYEKEQRILDGGRSKQFRII